MRLSGQGHGSDDCQGPRPTSDLCKQRKLDCLPALSWQAVAAVLWHTCPYVARRALQVHTRHHNRSLHAVRGARSFARSATSWMAADIREGPTTLRGGGTSLPASRSMAGSPHTNQPIQTIRGFGNDGRAEVTDLLAGHDGDSVENASQQSSEAATPAPASSAARRSILSAALGKHSSVRGSARPSVELTRTVSQVRPHAPMRATHARVSGPGCATRTSTTGSAGGRSRRCRSR